MTTAPFVSPSPSRLYSVPASPVPKSLGRSRTGVAFPARPCGFSLRLRSHVMAAAGVGGNGSPATPEDSTVSSRIGEVKRVTKETNVHVKINLDGTGVADCGTGIPFLDHMLDQLASHGLFDVYVKATGDTHIDDHHSNEDIALAIGTALLQALGDRKGINRFGHFTAPLDEAAVEVILEMLSHEVIFDLPRFHEHLLPIGWSICNFWHMSTSIQNGSIWSSSFELQLNYSY